MTTQILQLLIGCKKKNGNLPSQVLVNFQVCININVLLFTSTWYSPIQGWDWIFLSSPDFLRNKSLWIISEFCYIKRLSDGKLCSFNIWEYCKVPQFCSTPFRSHPPFIYIFRFVIVKYIAGCRWKSLVECEVAEANSICMSHVWIWQQRKGLGTANVIQPFLLLECWPPFNCSFHLYETSMCNIKS